MTQRILTRRTFLAGTGLMMLGRGGLLAPPPAWAAVAKVGAAAPAFTSTSTNGKPVSLGDYHGQIVVLEWTNHDCPYVRKHYDTGNMQARMVRLRSSGVGASCSTMASGNLPKSSRS